MKKFLVLFLLICSMVSAQPATPKYGQNIPPGGVLGFYPGDSKFYSLPVNASGALLVDSGEVPLWELNASGVVETLDDRAIDALSLQLSSDGTAAAPAISFGSDPNTGIYRYGADELGLTAGGLSMRYFTSSIFRGFTATTADASDDGCLFLAGGGGAAASRGSTFYLYGNEATGGYAGQAGVSLGVNGAFYITGNGGSNMLYAVASTSNMLIGTYSDDGVNKLQVNGNIAHAPITGTVAYRHVTTGASNLANDGVLETNIPATLYTSGVLHFVSGSEGIAAQITVVGTTPTKVTGSSAAVTTTKDNASTVNIYVESGTIKVQNKRGSGRSIVIGYDGVF